MLDAFRNMNRTVCVRARRFGALWGAFAVTARFDTAVDHAAMAAMLDPLSGADGVARCEVWTAADAAGASETEERLRGRDAKIAACAVVETLRQSDAERVCDQLAGECGATAELGIYRLLCALEPPAA